MIRGTFHMAVVTAVLAAAPIAAKAATLDVFVLGGVAMAGINAAPPEVDNFFFSSGPVETSVTSRIERAQAVGPFGSGRASASYAVDAARGQMRLSVDAAVTAVADGRGEASSLVQMLLSESFFVAGNGRVSVGMELDAFWDGEQSQVDACSGYNGSIGLTGVSFNSQCESFGNLFSGLGTGSVSGKLIEIAFDVDSPDGGLVDFSWTLNGQAAIPGGGPGLPSATAFLDASNTANLFFRTEGNVTVTPQSAGFLSDPAFGAGPQVPAVPLPTSALLLLSGLGGLTVLRRSPRRRG